MEFSYNLNDDLLLNSLNKSNVPSLFGDESIFNINNNNNDTNFILFKDQNFNSYENKSENKFMINSFNEQSNIFTFDQKMGFSKENDNQYFFHNDSLENDIKKINNFSPLSLITTSINNPLNIKEKNISIELDENSSKTKNFELNETTSLPYAIINLMKDKGAIDINTIVTSLEYRKNDFRKGNGSRYKNDFYKVIKSTLNTSGIFYKVEENNNNNSNKTVNKYYFIKNKEEYYLEKKRKREMDKILFNLKKKNEIIPTKLRIQLDKVNTIIKKLEKKYGGDNKYFQITFCIDMFKNLIKKYLFLIKKNKNNSLYDLAVLNEKIMEICQSIEKLEKNEIFEPKTEEVVELINEYNDENHKNVMLADGVNNLFTEPPNNKNQD